MSLASALLGGMEVGQRRALGALGLVEDQRRRQFYTDQALWEQQQALAEIAREKAREDATRRANTDLYGRLMPPPALPDLTATPTDIGPITTGLQSLIRADKDRAAFEEWPSDVQGEYLGVLADDYTRRQKIAEDESRHAARRDAITQHAKREGWSDNFTRGVLVANDLSDAGTPASVVSDIWKRSSPQSLGYDRAAFLQGAASDDPDAALASFEDPAGAPAGLLGMGFRGPVGKTPIPAEAQSLILRGLRENNAELVAEGMMAVGQLPTADTLRSGLQGKDPQYANFLKWQADGRRQEAAAAARALSAFEGSVAGALTKNAPRIEELRAAAAQAVQAANRAEQAYAEYVGGGTGATTDLMSEEAALDRAARELGPSATPDQIVERAAQLLEGGGGGP